jgi:hypothetical protein
MDVVSGAVVLAGEAAAEGSSTNPYLFGLTGFGVLVGLLIVTWMIKVGR